MQSLRFSVCIAIIVASGAASVLAQGGAAAKGASSCGLKQAPELAGFRLGMSLEAVKKSLADASMFDTHLSAKSSTGARAVNISAAELSEKAGDGIESVYLSFVDDRLTHIKVTFNGAGRWDGLQDFFARESERLGLPKPAGQSSFEGSGGNEKYMVRCEAFTAVLAYAFGVSPNVTVSDIAARSLVDRRRDKEETGVRRTSVRSLPSPFPQPPNPLPPQTEEPGPKKPDRPAPDQTRPSL